MHKLSLCCNAIPYDGTLPYVFVSYKDNDAKSLAIIEWLHRAGVRVWYDKGVDHSQEWPAIVASKLKNSHVCILLLSSKYEKSGPCTDELSMIKKNQKPFIPVFLSGYTPADSISLQLGGHTPLRADNFLSETDFLLRILSERILIPCRTTEPEAYDPPKQELEQEPKQKPKHEIEDGTKHGFKQDDRHFVRVVKYAVTMVIVLAIVTAAYFWITSNQYTQEESVATNAPQTVQFEGFTCMIEDGEATLLSYNGTKSDLQVPDVVENAAITTVSDHAFEGNTALSYVTFGKSVNRIGVSAFAGCSSLRQLRLANPEGVIAEPDAFSGCESLVAIEVASENYTLTVSENCRVFIIGAESGAGTIKEVLTEEDGVVYGRTDKDEATVLYVSNLFPAGEVFTVPEDVMAQDGAVLPVTYIESDSIDENSSMGGFLFPKEIGFSVELAERIEDLGLRFKYIPGSYSHCWLFTCFASFQLEKRRPLDVNDLLPSSDVCMEAMSFCSTDEAAVLADQGIWSKRENNELVYVIHGTLQDLYDYLRSESSPLSWNGCENYTEFGLGTQYDNNGEAISVLLAK